MKQFITEKELNSLLRRESWQTAAEALNQRFTEMTTQKQPEPLPEFEPFDIERAKAGDDIYNIDGVNKAKEYHIFSNGNVVVLWEETLLIGTFRTFEHLRHKRKAKPIEFNSLLDERGVWNKPSDFDTVELIGSIDGKDFMKATKGKATAYYLGKFNNGGLK